MVREISIQEYFEKKETLPLIDVRSPGEYEKGHIPQAVNIPLFTNKERAHVGTVYVQESKERAIELGYQYVTPKLSWFIDDSRKLTGSNSVAVHCWRGGMRSHAFANHLHSNGFDEVFVINGGYKAFRNHVLKSFEKPVHLHILGGYTGSGKTQILKLIKEKGEQVIDLEQLAHHKGSAFGAIGETMQPTVEQFENNLFAEWQKLNFNLPVWIEDESNKIGKIHIPMGLFRQMRQQNLYFIDVPKEQRAAYLVKEYTGFDDSMIEDSIGMIRERLGGQNAKAAIGFLNQKKYLEVAMLALQYYDKSYRRSMKDRNPNQIFEIPLSGTNHHENAEKVIQFISENE